MKKTDIIIIALLVMLLFIWPKLFPPTPPAPQPVNAPVQEQSTPIIESKQVKSPNQTIPPSISTPKQAIPEAQFNTLTNDFISLTCSTLGASIHKAILKTYPKTIDSSETFVALDFSVRPTLAFNDLSGFGTDSKYNVTQNGSNLVYRASRNDGLELQRIVTLKKDYQVSIQDIFINNSAQIVKVNRHDLQLGSMKKLPNVYSAGGTVGVDALLQYTKKVKHFGKILTKLAKSTPGETTSITEAQPLDWAAVKNKFFTHLLTIQRGELESPSGFRLYGKYNNEIKQLEEASIDLSFNEFTLEPGQQLSRKMDYFIGPKKYDILKTLPDEQAEVMEFGMLKFFSRILLSILNFFHDTIWPHNYGFAIILLTLAVRIVFWPLTHKSTESMKKMQLLAPEMKAIKEKYKDNAQKQQKATMALYKEHKVNPLSGCLPMLVQFPVFIALFFVLRSAVELRFAEFLWVRDLSEPERLWTLKGVFPFDLAINLLPFLMAITMFVQQKLTPSTGDPTQQKIMQFFPIMLLFFLYNMPSGLLLYWSTSNLLMIIQQVINLKNKKKKEKTK